MPAIGLATRPAVRPAGLAARAGLLLLALAGPPCAHRAQRNRLQQAARLGWAPSCLEAGRR